MKRAELIAMQKSLREAFASELEGLRGKGMGLKPKQIEDMKAGFGDGLGAMVRVLVQAGHLKVED